MSSILNEWPYSAQFYKYKDSQLIEVADKHSTSLDREEQLELIEELVRRWKRERNKATT